MRGNEAWKAACFLSWRWGLVSRLVGRFWFEWVTNRCLCLLGEQGAVSPRCGLFALGCPVHASAPLSLHKSQSNVATTQAGLSSGHRE